MILVSSDRTKIKKLIFRDPIFPQRDQSATTMKDLQQKQLKIMDRVARMCKLTKMKTKGEKPKTLSKSKTSNSIMQVLKQRISIQGKAKLLQWSNRLFRALFITNLPKIVSKSKKKRLRKIH